mmetsp:Transcript_18064/g.50528  ORF Transcript_18064/g.50528 Transcript_18064/m.50528 type:complete len:497 (+) Transcript_18064:1408-2898(+)
MLQIRSGTAGWTMHTFEGSMRASKRAVRSPSPQRMQERLLDSRPLQSGRKTSSRLAACRTFLSSELPGVVAASTHSRRRSMAFLSLVLRRRPRREADADSSSLRRSSVPGSLWAPMDWSSLRCGMKAAGTSKANGDRLRRSRLKRLAGLASRVALATGTKATCERRAACEGLRPSCDRCCRMEPNTSSTGPASWAGQQERAASPPSPPTAARCSRTRSKGGGERSCSFPWWAEEGGKAMASSRGTRLHTNGQSLGSAAFLYDVRQCPSLSPRAAGMPMRAGTKAMPAILPGSPEVLSNVGCETRKLASLQAAPHVRSAAAATGAETVPPSARRLTVVPPRASISAAHSSNKEASISKRSPASRRMATQCGVQNSRAGKASGRSQNTSARRGLVGSSSSEARHSLPRRRPSQPPPSAGLSCRASTSASIPASTKAVPFSTSTTWGLSLRSLQAKLMCCLTAACVASGSEAKPGSTKRHSSASGDSSATPRATRAASH